MGTESIPIVTATMMAMTMVMAIAMPMVLLMVIVVVDAVYERLCVTDLRHRELEVSQLCHNMRHVYLYICGTGTYRCRRSVTPRAMGVTDV